MHIREAHRVLVWSGWLRLSHWLIAAGLVFQLTSAWLIDHARVDVEFWHDWHLMVGLAVSLALSLRLGLLFRSGASHWRNLIPGRAQRQVMPRMVKFYLSFGRLPLPDWYAHNPFWLPVYTIMLLLLILVLLTGILHGTELRILGRSPLAWHGATADLLGIIAGAHVVAVILHDWKGKGADISAMFSGYRCFSVHVDEVGRPAVRGRSKPVQVSLDGLGKGSRDVNRRGSGVRIV